MPVKKEIDQLTQEEANLKHIWGRILSYLRKDLGLVWTEEAKQRFEELKTELDKIKFILERLEEHAGKKKHSAALKDIADLKSKLRKVKPTARWVNGMTNEIKELLETERKIVSRRRFLKAAGAAAGGGLLYSLGRRFGLFSSRKPAETPEQAAKRKANEKIAAIKKEIEDRFVHKRPGNYKINYQNYADTLDILFNAGEYDAAKVLCDNSHEMIVPVKRSVLNELTKAFSHEVEIEYLFFADKQGRIIRAERTPVEYEYTRGTVWRDYPKSDELIYKLEKEGYTFVGTYHNHTRTKEEIKKYMKGSGGPNFEENVPSPDDWGIFRETKGNEYGLIGQKEKIIMNGGIDRNKDHKFNIRVFTGGEQFNPKPYGTYKKFARDYNKSKGKLQNSCLKLELKLKVF